MNGEAGLGSIVGHAGAYTPGPMTLSQKKREHTFRAIDAGHRYAVKTHGGQEVEMLFITRRGEALSRHANE